MELAANSISDKRQAGSKGATTLLVILCCIAYPFGLRYSVLSCSYDNVFTYGNWWSVFTAIFMHGSLGHLLGNMLFLFLFGRALEKYIGSFMLLVVFVSGGAISMFISVFYYPHNVNGLGASGAISAILATLMLFSPWKISILLNLFPMPLGVAAFTFFLLNIGGLYLDRVHPKQGGTQVAYFAHLTGFLAGIAWGIILSPTWKKNLFICIIQFIIYYLLLVGIFRYFNLHFTAA